MRTLFGVKDYQKTYDNHKSRFTKLETIPYEDIIDYGALETITGGVEWRIDHLKEIKSLKVRNWSIARVINAITWQYIQNALTDYGLTKYYATAFYIKHYEAVNSLMYDVLIELNG